MEYLNKILMTIYKLIFNGVINIEFFLNYYQPTIIYHYSIIYICLDFFLKLKNFKRSIFLDVSIFLLHRV